LENLEGDLVLKLKLGGNFVLEIKSLFSIERSQNKSEAIEMLQTVGLRTLEILTKNRIGMFRMNATELVLARAEA